MVNNCCVVATIQLARRKALVFIVFPSVTKIGVRNGYQLYVGEIGYQTLIPEFAVSTSSQVVKGSIANNNAGTRLDAGSARYQLGGVARSRLPYGRTN